MNYNRGRGGVKLRDARTHLLLMIFVFLVILPFLLMKGQAAVPSGTGIGIRKDGPLKAQIGDIIEYVITVYNLGDYWIRNITVKDTFPNGTFSLWNISDLAPLEQLGDSYNISGILYTIKAEDVLPEPRPHVINRAEVTGYSDVEDLPVLVRAQTDYPTLIVKPPVACFTLSNENPPVCENVTFNASCSYDPDGWIVKYEWDWEGDGVYDFDAGNNSIAVHHYAQFGIYYPKLRVTDNDNLTNETMRRIVVYLPPVGGYSISIKNKEPLATYSIYIILLSIITSVFMMFRYARKFVF